MLHISTILIGCLAFAVAMPPPSEQDSHQGGGGRGPPSNGGPSHNHGGPHPHGGPSHRQGGPPNHGGPQHGGPKVQYTYDRVARLASLINMLTHECNKEFGKANEFWMEESPTARAIEENKNLIDFLTEHDFTECLPSSNSSVKEYMKKNVEVINTCMAGWKLDTTIQEEAKTMLEKLKEIDDEAKTQLENCKPGETCYQEFLKSDLKKSIDEQLNEIRQGTFVDARLHADSTSFAAVGDVALCIMNNTKELRLEIYNSNAAIKVCAAVYGMPLNHH